MGREPSLHSLDIDGIIQSFVREQEMAQMAQQGPNARINSADATIPMHSQWSHPGTDASGASLLGEPQYVNTFPYDANGSWMQQGPQPFFGDAAISVDDLLYGFNGSAADSFLEWDAM